MELDIYQIDAFTDKVFGGNPACVIPVGVSSSSNIPIAIQIIGGQRQDLDVLNAMQAFEKVINFSDKATDHE